MHNRLADSIQVNVHYQLAPSSKLADLDLFGHMCSLTEVLYVPMVIQLSSVTALILYQAAICVLDY